MRARQREEGLAGLHGLPQSCRVCFFFIVARYMTGSALDRLKARRALCESSERGLQSPSPFSLPRCSGDFEPAQPGFLSTTSTCPNAEASPGRLSRFTAAAAHRTTDVYLATFEGSHSQRRPAQPPSCVGIPLKCSQTRVSAECVGVAGTAATAVDALRWAERAPTLAASLQLSQASTGCCACLPVGLHACQRWFQNCACKGHIPF